MDLRVLKTFAKDVEIWERSTCTLNASDFGRANEKLGPQESAVNRFSLRRYQDPLTSSPSPPGERDDHLTVQRCSAKRPSLVSTSSPAAKDSQREGEVVWQLQGLGAFF
jgi:hypothetical protein